MNKTDSLGRLAREYISKVDFCDECFATWYCTSEGRRESRVPCSDENKCAETIIDYLQQLQPARSK